MDFKQLGRAARGLASNSNLSEPIDLQNLPVSILESAFPAYRLISRLFMQYTGFDIGTLASIFIFAIPILTSLHYAWRKLPSILSNTLTSSVYIDEHDDLYKSVMKWIASQKLSQRARSIKAITQKSKSWEQANADEVAGVAMGPDGLFNFGKWAANVPPMYEPYYGLHYFIHEKRVFFINRSRRPNGGIMTGSLRTSEEELLQIKCFGISTKPARRLIDHIKKWAVEKEKSMTVIRRPGPKEMRRGYWNKASSRPSRPINTVVLDAEQKGAIISDINEYLHPGAPRWYASRGIPYRRGYLFHGPPGTGKTSLSFALAGIFGLEIHVISLLEPTLTESDLGILFDNLPRRCIVLLEDVDAAGLTRNKGDPSADGNAKEIESSKGKNATGKPLTNGVSHETQDTPDPASPANVAAMTDLTKALQTATRQSRFSGGLRGIADPVTQGISLSGLLNTIDGVASHEGRVLIMTSNHPEILDPALVRPGRVDMKIKFGLAGRDQTIELFERMFENSDKLASSLPSSPTTSGFPSTPVMEQANEEKVLSREELEYLARKFADKLPDEQFSPAEIQGFLLTRRKNPQKAVDETEAWRDEVLASRDREKS
ncbi:MAG: hypothetical protein M1820_001555 [Bogoriella megaspora]|nr:MAG: hypothetical protein M1820_001555 [Bogoriella megaspora]